LPFKPNRLTLPRRSIIAATAGLASAAALGKYGRAQIAPEDLPDAGAALAQMAPQPAPALAFTNADGKALSLKTYAGHGLVVNFWATWCGPCVAELPSFAAAAPALRKDKILVLPISIDMDGAQAVQPFYASHGITTLPVLLDADGNALDALNAPGIPVTLIINAAGQLVGRLDGAANWNTPGTLKTILQLAGAPVGTPKPNGGVLPI
jgi:thiol-disulfide isomerase/thioredoxin